MVIGYFIKSTVAIEEIYVLGVFVRILLFYLNILYRSVQLYALVCAVAVAVAAL